MVKTQNTGAPASGSTAVAASTAATAAATGDPIAPTLPADPSEVEKGQWRVSASSEAAMLLEGDERPRRMSAMALIDYHLNGGEKSDDYFDNVLEGLGLGNAGDKRMMRTVTAATQLNRADPSTGEKAKKTLDVMASATERLDKLAADAGIKFLYDPQCVRDLIDLFDLDGGYTAAANEGRKKDPETSDDGVFAIDTGKAQEHCLGIAADRLAHAAGDFVVPMGAPDIEVDRRVFEEALAKSDLHRGPGYGLWQLIQTTSTIVRQETNQLVNRDDDPKGKKVNGKLVKPKKRFTEPHIVSRPDGSFVVSGHLAAAGNVLHVEGLLSVFADHPGFDVMMHPKWYRKLAKNLDTPLRRNVIQVSEGAPNAGTSHAVRTYRLHSGFAKEEAYQPGGHGLSISWLLPTYDAAKGNTVKDVRGDRVWEPLGSVDMSPTGFIRGFVLEQKHLDHASSRKQARPLKLENGMLSLSSAAQGVSLECPITDGGAGNISTYVMAADLKALLVFLTDKRFVTGTTMELARDSKRQALRWTLTTGGVDYRLYMPVATEHGSRVADAFEAIKLKTPPAPKTK